MKRLYLLIAVCILPLGIFAQIGKPVPGKNTNTATPATTAPANPADPTVTQQNGTPIIEFETEKHDFGRIEKGVIAKYRFKFTNTGTADLVINNVHASCGCTTPSWSKDPVKPGESGFIEAAYNSNAGHGPFAKTVTVSTNIPNQVKVLTIQGEVIFDDTPPSPVRVTGN